MKDNAEIECGEFDVVIFSKFFREYRNKNNRVSEINQLKFLKIHSEWRGSSFKIDDS